VARDHAGLARRRREPADTRPVPEAVSPASADRSLLSTRGVPRARGGGTGHGVHPRRSGAARTLLVSRQEAGRGGDRRRRGARWMTMSYVSILMVFAVAALVAGALLGIPALIAPKRLSRVKLEPFECGKDPIALPEGRFAIKFSTIAIFFIIFDIELIFIWPWATLYRQLGSFGFGEMMVFLGILMLGFLYIWRKKGLVWE